MAVVLGGGDEAPPSALVSIRKIEEKRFDVVDERTGITIEDVEESKAFYSVYPGAVFLQQDKTYLCSRLDLKRRVATVRRVDVK